MKVEVKYKTKKNGWRKLCCNLCQQPIQFRSFNSAQKYMHRLAPEDATIPLNFKSYRVG